MNLAENLARYASRLTYADLGRSTVEETKKRIVDALGCAVGAYREEPVRIGRRVATDLRARQGSTVIGTPTKAAPEVATFVNGLMIRYFDFNDTYLSKEPAHPSDNLGATLSVAESVRAGGKELILATALAYEVQCRLCDSADIRHRGWDHVCFGLVSSALGAGKLMGLGEEQLVQAVNISLSAHIAMRQVRAGELSMWKGASFSNAARNAVFAARLAKEGMTGPSPVFEGEMGFFKQVSGPFALDVSKFGRGGKGFKVGETYIKYYPAEYHAQTAVSAALEVRELVGRGEDIETVEVRTHEAGYTILGKDPEKWRPATKETADHSLPFMVGMALLEGRLDNKSYSEKNLHDEHILGFLKRIRVEEDKSLTALYPSKGMANRVTLVTKGGKRYSKEVKVPKGHPLNPMDSSEVEEKFRRLTRGLLPKGRTDGVLEKVWSLEKVTDLGDVVRLLEVDGSRGVTLPP